MSLTLEELARHCGATLEGGDPKLVIATAATLQEAGPSDVAPLTDIFFTKFLSETKAGAVVLKRDDHPPVPKATGKLYADDPEMAFVKILEVLYPKPSEEAGIDPSASIESDTVIEEGAYVGPHAIVRKGTKIGAGSHIMGGVHIGRNCTIGQGCSIHPNVVLYDDVVIGNHVAIHAGCVIGADGYGYKFRDGRHVKVPQVGKVIIEDHVEIGSCTCIDRGALGDTVIGIGSKIDNLVQIGHNVKLGPHVIVCGQAGFAGSAEVDAYAMIGARAGISNRVKIGTAAKVGAKAGVMKDVGPQAEVFGIPADDRRSIWRQIAAFRKLPAWAKRIRDLERDIEQLKKEHEQ